ncbi:MAG TPA: aminotransferase class V-fold PLP-dependent enzyme [Polyangiaceae bacterium]|nr:aminotransferase class V-fold PLP-dependent enzyme [Polyangiaceae bacterium]
MNAQPKPARSQFAPHFSLDPNIVYLNHGAFGACPKPVQAAQQEFRARLERNPLNFFLRELEREFDRVRGVLAPFLGAKPEDLAFVPNATAGVNTVLASIEQEAGSEVVIADHTYPACKNAVQYWATRRGVRVRVAQFPFPLASADQLSAAILREVTPKTRLVLLDHVTSPSGLILPLESLVRTLGERGIDTLVDGAHGPGMLPIDLERLGATYYTGNLHKWCCAPKGAAFLWVSRERQPRIHPLVISHGWAVPRDDRPRFLLEFDWPGTLDPSAVLSVPVALEFLAGLFDGKLEGLYAHNRALALRGRDALCAALGTTPPAPDSMLGSLAAVLFPEHTPKVPTPDALYAALLSREIEVPIVPLPGFPSGFVRIAAQVYNSEAEFAFLGQALREELGIG